MNKRVQMLNARRKKTYEQYQKLPFADKKRKELWLDVQILDLQIRKERLKEIRSNHKKLKA